MPEAVLPRVAHLQVAPDLKDLWDKEAGSDTPQSRNWLLRAMTLGRAMPAALVTEDGGFNDPRVRMAEIPGAGGIATADALAAIWSATVTKTEGVTLLTPRILARATAVASEGPPVFPVPGPYARWGMGFQLDSEARRYLTDESFGHDGAGGQIRLCRPRLRRRLCLRHQLDGRRRRHAGDHDPRRAAERRWATAGRDIDSQPVGSAKSI